ncbi:cysteine-rich receptor-kinase-like protein [Medicago truncatula]|uniref:Cysteine-rich receptor-kinase-like protein n=1 Tax=Medicago truncatula TaxID=3880 RepID=A0A072VQ98_MEDTR|nr:cysteine-rich receptor-kinase-like protein [Medicago truncatula]
MTTVSSKLLFSFYSVLFIIIIVSQAQGQPNFLRNYCINNNGNYTANSTYQNNLSTLLSNLTSNTEINYGFYNFSYGQNTDKVNAVGLCRGDVKPDVCRSCLNDSRVLLTKLCPNQKEAIGWYVDCMLRYSNRSIFGVMEASPSYLKWTLKNATEVDQFNQVLGNLMRKLKEIAASSDSRRKFATANATLNFETTYGLVQCTPDLSQQDCNDCLERAISEIPIYFNNKVGGIVLKPSCNIRHEIYSFYDPTPVIDPGETSPSEEEKSKSSHTTIAIVVPTVVVVVASLLIFICICVRKRKAKINLEDIEDDNNDIEIAESLLFNFETLRVATSNFSEANKLGHGGFGIVYQGILAGGQVIAIKRLSTNSGQGDIEFKNEKAQLDWERRYKIIGGIARGLLYLHQDSQLRIIHRDLKAGNILLDEKLNPKISDFGIARLLLVDQTQVNTNKIVGTYGYMAPEYVMFGEFSIKSDVFSFGVLVLEIISGQKACHVFHAQRSEDLLSFAWRNWREGTITNIIDPSLSNGSRNEIMRCIHIALLCVQENLVERPIMATVVLMLSSYYITLAVPLEPASIVGGRSRSLPVRDMQFEGESRNHASITDPYPR